MCAFVSSAHSSALSVRAFQRRWVTWFRATKIASRVCCIIRSQCSRPMQRQTISTIELKVRHGHSHVSNDWIDASSLCRVSMLICCSSVFPPSLCSPAFLQWFRSTRLTELIAETPEFLAQNKAAVVANLTEKEKNLGEMHNRLWGEIERRRFDWAHQDRVAAAVALITLDSLLAFWDRYIAMDAPQRRKMSFQYFSQGGDAPHALPAKMERYTAEAVKFANEKLVLKAKQKEEAAPAAADASAAPAPAAAAESVFLPPVPVDPRPIVYIEDVVAFKNSQCLYPAML